ncbi:MAG TPA: sigma factor-like helix-turn-helix DNA-binding protein [Candidatus Acidoferrales bacterium]|nr:sigma factor-like helix-turn-helix DNA-binding protein [Candidatus Acidoferrales bacterium]
MNAHRKPYLRSEGAMTWAEIGAKLGTSGESARQVYQRALRKLRREHSLAKLREMAGSGLFR